jgi:metal-responsive CopG/Arc/MetJ family transcriptional regulator
MSEVVDRPVYVRPARPSRASHCDVKLPVHLARRLDAAAARSSISRSAMIRAILSDVLPPEEIA